MDCGITDGYLNEKEERLKNNLKDHLGLGSLSEEEAKRKREKDGSKTKVHHTS